MDQQKLRTLVFERTGVKVDSDDPIFALVALNETVLAESVALHVAAMDEATARLSLQVSRLLGHGQGQIPAEAAADSESESGHRAPLGSDGLPHEPASAQRDQPAQTGINWPMLAGAGVLAIGSAVLTLSGQWLLFGSSHQAGAQPGRSALSPEQNALVENAGKITRAVQNLDEKTRLRIQTEIQKQTQ